MRRPGGKLIAGFLAVACIAIAGTLWGLRERIAEEWWLRKLETAGSHEERNQAAEQLGAMGSLRAVPRLIRRVKDGRPVRIEIEAEPISPAFPCYVPDLPVSRRATFGDDDGFDPGIMTALRAIVTSRGEESLDPLLAALKDERLPVQRRAVELLGCLGPRAERAVPALSALLDAFPEPALEAEIVDALHRIGLPPAPAVRAYLARRGWR